MPLATAARAETSPCVVYVHFGFRAPTFWVVMPDCVVLAVFEMFCPNIGQSATCAASASPANSSDNNAKTKRTTDWTNMVPPWVTRLRWRKTGLTAHWRTPRGEGL